MSRRPLVSPDDSLELLLDTICNTFGAVIFISILASVLAQNSAPPGVTPEQSAAAIEETYTRQKEVSELKRRQALLETQLAQQQELIRRFSSEESVSLAIQIHEDSKSQADMVSRKADAAQAMVLSEREKLQLEQALQQQLEQLRQQQEEQADAENNLRNMETLEGHTAEIRRVHETTKFGFTFALDNGRLYSVHTSEESAPSPMSLMINREECAVTEEGGATVIRPLPNQGLLIRGQASARQAAKTKLRVVGNRFIVRLFVAKDSFAEFLPVKEAMTELGIEYAIEVMSGDDVELFLTDKVQDRTFVQ